MSNKIGVADGNMDVSQAVRWTAGWYDIAEIDISGSATEDISMDTLLGSDCVVRDIKSAVTSAGNILVKTANDESGGYVTIPIGARERLGLLPRIKYIKKTGSINTAIVWYQKVNQG